MSGSVLRRGLLAPVLLAALATRAGAQQAGKTQVFPTADAAATALTEAVRKDDDKAIAAMLGEWWRVFVPNRERDFGRERTLYLAAWDDRHKVNVDGDKAIVEVGKTGWTLPIPIVKDGAEWRFDSEAGIDELGALEVDAQQQEAPAFAVVHGGVGRAVEQVQVSDDFAQDLSVTEKQTLAVTQGPIAAVSLGTPATTPAWLTKPSWYMVASEDRVLSPKLEATMAQTINAETITVRSSHVIMLSRPDAVADVIARAAQGRE